MPILQREFTVTFKPQNRENLDIELTLQILVPILSGNSTLRFVPPKLYQQQGSSAYQTEYAYDPSFCDARIIFNLLQNTTCEFFHFFQTIQEQLRDQNYYVYLGEQCLGKIERVTDENGISFGAGDTPQGEVGAVEEELPPPEYTPPLPVSPPEYCDSLAPPPYDQSQQIAGQQQMPLNAEPAPRQIAVSAINSHRTISYFWFMLATGALGVTAAVWPCLLLVSGVNVTAMGLFPSILGILAISLIACSAVAFADNQINRILLHAVKTGMQKIFATTNPEPAEIHLTI